MTSNSVCVLAPNGRRQTVKCSPNTTILQIIEEVCRKQGFKPEEYDIKHHNKVLDTTTTFRFSGLPNNAQLELATASKTREETDVTLAVNLENGSRVMGNFKPSENLLNVLKNLCPESIGVDLNPVVIFTRREIFGNELEKTTLKSLGLTGGRAMIRLIHRSPDELKTQANISAPLPSKPVEEKPYRRVLQRVESPPRVKEVVQQDNNGNENNEKEDLDSKSDAPPKVQKNNTTDILKLAREKRKIEQSSPKHDKRTEPPKKSEKTFKEEITPMDIDVVSDEEKKPPVERYKSIEEEFVFLGDRNAMLFSLESAQSVPSEDLPDDFFDLTIDDARKILRDVKRKRESMEETPLLTSTLRNLEESKKQLRSLNKYKKSIIRVLFPDRTVLQGTFAPVDTIQDVLNFVRDYLEDKTLDFYVYFTPPKSILDKESRLLEIGCVPGALLHFGTNSKDKDVTYLRKELQDKFTTNSMASLAATRMRHEATRPGSDAQIAETDFEIQENLGNGIDNTGASTSSGITHEDYGERKIVRSTENVPKWFKPSK